MTKTKTEKLVVLYQQMADLTAPQCAASCRVPHSCCDAMYCEMSINYAKRVWDVELAKTNHPTLPLMGESGCTAPPHLRPLCTLHTCAISSLGFHPTDAAWTKQYFRLRNKLERLMPYDAL